LNVFLRIGTGRTSNLLVQNREFQVFVSAKSSGRKRRGPTGLSLPSRSAKSQSFSLDGLENWLRNGSSELRSLPPEQRETKASAMVTEYRRQYLRRLEDSNPCDNWQLMRKVLKWKLLEG